MNELRSSNSHAKFLTITNTMQDFLNEDMVSFRNDNLAKYMHYSTKNKGFLCLPTESYGCKVTTSELYYIITFVNSEQAIYDNYINYYESLFK